MGDFMPFKIILLYHSRRHPIYCGERKVGHWGSCTKMVRVLEREENSDTMEYYTFDVRNPYDALERLTERYKDRRWIDIQKAGPNDIYCFVYRRND